MAQNQKSVGVDELLWISKALLDSNFHTPSHKLKPGLPITENMDIWVLVYRFTIF